MEETGAALESGPDAGAVGPDGGGAPSNSDGGSNAVACDEPVANVPNGNHRPGEPCLACHTAGGEGPAFTLGGTLYTDLIGSAAIPGATIHVIDANGTDIPLITAQNGNFWSKDPIAYPVQVSASLCPDSVPMAGAVSETGGDCNMGGCHGSTFRIKLP